MSTVRLTGTTSGYVELTAPAVAGNNTLTLPTGNGAADQRLVTNGSGALSFSSDVMLAAGSAGSPSLYFSGDTNTGIFSPGADQVAVATNGTERLFVDASGNVRINTSSAAANRLTVNEAVVGVSTPIRVQNASAGANGRGVGLEFYGISNTFGRLEGFWSGTEEQVRLFSTGGTTFSTAGLERLRITSAGLVGIGTTSPVTTLDVNGPTRLNATATSFTSASGAIVQTGSGTSGGPVAIESIAVSTVTRHHISFSNPNGVVGSISTNGSATAYNTSSDYRLKENVVDLDGAIDRLKQLPVHRFNFIADPNTVVDGFIAHEAAEVVPECVTGTKDEVDEDGNPVYQGIDQSKIVPLLTAALQEAVARIEQLESQLNNPND